MTTNHANFVICGCPWQPSSIKSSSKMWKVLVVVIVFLWIGNFIVKDFAHQKNLQYQREVANWREIVENKIRSGELAYQSEAMKKVVNNMRIELPEDQ